jgi:hypothetical protein
VLKQNPYCGLLFVFQGSCIVSDSATRQNGCSKVPYERRLIRDIPRKEYPIYPTGPDPLNVFDAVIRLTDNVEAVRQTRN